MYIKCVNFKWREWKVSSLNEMNEWNTYDSDGDNICRFITLHPANIKSTHFCYITSSSTYVLITNVIKLSLSNTTQTTLKERNSNAK